ncbi:MAG: hypothetical protein KKA65_04725 [Nanoarchaeota archaeon]|nr:hypothetical protein [Nanoarchaeota archaeon]MBU4351983.1 hypothetical protein [Nanoarchaeota archaeon]MBU4456780.1 hypothetical protein [Nanoarchaeota archaeon]MCG2720247.1 hypothetical protein [Nanoarchaeota archaeon]
MINSEKLSQKIDRIVNCNYLVEANMEKECYTVSPKQIDSIVDNKVSLLPKHDINSEIKIKPLLEYLINNEPLLFPNLEERVGNYEKDFEKIKIKIKAGKLKGRIEQGLYVPVGNPNNHPKSLFDNMGSGGLGLLVICGLPFIDLGSGIERLSGKIDYKPIKKILGSLDYTCYKLGEIVGAIGFIPVCLILNSIDKLSNIGKGYTKSEKVYFKLEEQRGGILRFIEYLDIIVNEDLKEDEITEFRKYMNLELSSGSIYNGRKK